MNKITIFSMLLALACLTYADEPAVPPEQEDGAIASEPVKPEALGEKYGISPDSINFLKENYKIGYGGVGHALELAKLSGKTPEEILAMKTIDKMGWGVIKKELGLGPEKSEAKLEKMDSNQGQVKKQEKMQQKMDKALLKAERKQNKEKGAK